MRTGLVERGGVAGEGLGWWKGAGLAGRAGLWEGDISLAFAWLAPSALEGALSYQGSPFP